MCRKKALFFLVCLVVSIACGAQASVCDSLLLLKRQLYGFRVADLTQAQREETMRRLDLFWNAARRSASAAAPCVAQMIREEQGDSYFCYDAAGLLLLLDTTTTYHAAVVEGLSKAELSGLQLAPFVQLTVYLGTRGQDISGPFRKLIGLPGATVFLPDHFVTLSAIDAGIFIINTQPEQQQERLLADLVRMGSPTERHNAAVLLNLLSTPGGDSLLAAWAPQLADSTQAFIRKDRKTFVISPKGTQSRAQVLEALADVPYNPEKEFFGFAGNDALIGSACLRLGVADLDKVRDARRRATPGLSDEALHEYFALTTILTTIRAREKKLAKK